MANRRPPRGQESGPGRGKRPERPARRGNAPGHAPASNTPNDGEPAGEERLQKVLAHAGVGSRRACEDVILQGRVAIDGKIVRELGTKVDASIARIEVDGQRIQSERMVYFAVSKPKGYVSTNNDPSGRPRVVDLLPEIPQRVYTVGRLDEMSTGLILLTNDGELANRLAHPKFGVEKLYRVVVAGTPQREALDKITEGIWLAEGKVRARRVRVIGHKGQASILEMVLAEGKNREVRRMMAKLGHKVMSLTRIAVGPVTLKGLGPGEYRSLTRGEIDLLQKVAAGLAIAPARFPERKSRLSNRPKPATSHRRTDEGEGSQGGGGSSRPPARAGIGKPGRPGGRPVTSRGPRVTNHQAEGREEGGRPMPRKGASQSLSGTRRPPVGAQGGRPPRPGGARDAHSGNNNAGGRPPRPGGVRDAQSDNTGGRPPRPGGARDAHSGNNNAGGRPPRPSGARDAQSDNNTGGRPPRPGGVRDAQTGNNNAGGRPPRPGGVRDAHSGNDNAGGRPPRPQGLPPSKRPKSRPPLPADEPPPRHIIGLASGPAGEMPPRPRPRRMPPKRSFPRAALPPRRPSDDGDGDE